jgi:hypothetical protein
VNPVPPVLAVPESMNAVVFALVPDRERLGSVNANLSLKYGSLTLDVPSPRDLLELTPNEEKRGIFYENLDTLAKTV